MKKSSVSLRTSTVSWRTPESDTSADSPKWLPRPRRLPRYLSFFSARGASLRPAASSTFKSSGS